MDVQPTDRTLVRATFGDGPFPEGRPAPSGVLIDGLVVHGDKRGRELGFPTANLPIDDKGVGDGVWAATVELADGRLLPAAVSIGRRVTFYGRDGVRLLEAYLLDFTGDLYGQHLRVWLEHRLRLQRRFPDVESLIEQMWQDVEDARAWAQCKRRADVAGAVRDPLAGLG